MKSTPIYLDNAATTPMREEVLAAMLPWLTSAHGNASSLHYYGREARMALYAAQVGIAEQLGALDADILFTSGGTESNNLALKGMAYGLREKGRHLIVSAIEHPASLDTVEWLAREGFDITLLPVDAEGFVSPKSLEAAIRRDTVLVSVMHANNEIGTIEPIAALGAICRARGVLFHTDAAQTLGKLPIRLDTLPVDLLSGSAHKFYGPKGVGLLYANANARSVLTPWLHGGGQQQGLRSGTENLAGIIGMHTALILAEAERETVMPRLRTMQTRLIAGIQKLIPDALLNGPSDADYRLSGNVNFAFPPLEGEALVLRCDLNGLCVSSGSACHSATLTGSHVLRALGRTEAQSRASVRFSLGRNNTDADVDAVLAKLPGILEKAGYFRTHAQAATIR